MEPCWGLWVVYRTPTDKQNRKALCFVGPIDVNLPWEAESARAGLIAKGWTDEHLELHCLLTPELSTECAGVNA